MTAAAVPALRIIVGADEAGVHYKNRVMEDLRAGTYSTMTRTRCTVLLPMPW